MEKSQVSDIPMSWLEVKNVLKSIRKGLVPGIDEVSMSMIKAAGIHVLQWLYSVEQHLVRKDPRQLDKGHHCYPLQEEKQVEIWQL